MPGALIVFRDNVMPKSAFEAGQHWAKYRHTFPIVDAELSEELVEFCGLQDGLVKFARALMDQYKDAVGVEIHAIGVTFLKPKHDDAQRP